MDQQTLQAYDQGAAGYADDWLAQPAPDDMYAMLQQYFSAGPSADIGCGAGRDTAWLNQHGYQTTGFDASAGLLTQAQARYPQLRFQQAALPELAGLANAQFQNILCETVIMHLAPADITAATTRLLQLLKSGGVLYLSWRVTDGASQRDKHERLYAAFDQRLVLDACAGHEILFNQQQTSLSSGKTIQRVLVRKAA